MQRGAFVAPHLAATWAALTLTQWVALFEGLLAATRREEPGLRSVCQQRRPLPPRPWAE